MARRALIPRLLCASLTAIGLTVATTSVAEDAHATPRILARPSACRDLPWSGDAWIDLLRVELAADGARVVFSSASADDDGAPEVTIDPASCEASAASATLLFTSGDVRRARVVSLSDVPKDARPRVLAIAMAQLVREGMALEKAPPDLPPPSRAAAHLAIDLRVQYEPPPAAKPLRAPRPPPLLLFASGEARTFARASTGLFGARAGARVAIVAPFAIDLDAGALFGEKDDPLGRVGATLATAGASALATAGDARFAFGVGPRIEAGYAIFRGRRSEPSFTESTARAPVVFFALTAEGSARVASSISAFVALDAGATLLSYGARADDRVVAAFDGAMLSLRIGLAWSAAAD